MKVCSKCREEKDVEEFYFRKDSGKHRNECKACTYKHSRVWKLTNKDMTREQTYRWRKVNPVAYRAISKKAGLKRYKNNKEYFLLQNKKRRVRTLERTPVWYDKEDDEAMEDLIELQQLAKDTWEIRLHIDHIIPLRGKNVSGLHCKENWQLLTAFDNLSKGNKFE